MLLLACAVTAIIALGTLTDPGLNSEQADASTVPATEGDSLGKASTTSVAQALAPIPPGDILAPLLNVRPSDRFADLTLAATLAPSVVENSQIISYYGSPHTSAMGILGAGDPETMASQLEEQAARYDRLNGATDVVPAFHLVYAVAQSHPTGNGLYLQYADDALVRRYVELTEERGMLLFLDLQIGRSSVEAEVEKVLPYLQHEHVHLAIDPEFAVGPGEVPGVALGSVQAEDIERAQAIIQELVREESLPPKLLIVHQFADSMVLDGETIQRCPGVELVIDMDGFGDAAIKGVTYERYAARSYASLAAIKLFFDHDPDLMSEEEVLRLEPRPSIVIYQ